MTFLGQIRSIFVMAMVALTLLPTGCVGDKLQFVPADGAAADQIDGMTLDHLNDSSVDNLEVGDVPIIDTSNDVMMADADVIDAGDSSMEIGVDVLPDSDVITDQTDVVSDADGGSPCPMSRPTTCGGACVDIQTDANNCGGCDTSCARPNASTSCAAGVCQLRGCAMGFADCDGVASNGCEVSLLIDATHCGACSTRCGDMAPLCQAGACTSMCMSPTTTCSGGRCVDTRSDPANCGRCDNICTPPSNAMATCAAGVCGYTCFGGFHDCSGTCLNGMSVMSCGASCTPCPTGPNATASCDGTTCSLVCNAGFANCDGVASNGCEVDLSSDVSNCGRCATVCAFSNATATCVASACTLGTCNAGFGNCDSMAANGCELDTSSNPTNCGRCGGTCSGTCTGSLCNVIVSVTSGGRLARESDSNFAVCRSALTANNVDTNAAASTYLQSGIYGVVRGWLFVAVPTGVIVSASLRFSPPYVNRGDRNPGMGVQGVSFTTSATPARVPLANEYELSHWGTNPFFVDPILMSAFMSTTDARADISAAGIVYLQAGAGRTIPFGLRTTYDIDSSPPIGDYSGVELGTMPNAQFIFRMRP